MKENKEKLKDRIRKAFDQFKERLTKSAIRKAVVEEIKTPKFWINTTFVLTGIITLAVASWRLASVKTENKLLRAENMELGKEINKSWYFIGKLTAQKKQQDGK